MNISNSKNINPFLPGLSCTYNNESMELDYLNSESTCWTCAPEMLKGFNGQILGPPGLNFFESSYQTEEESKTRLSTGSTDKMAASSMNTFPGSASRMGYSSLSGLSFSINQIQQPPNSQMPLFGAPYMYFANNQTAQTCTSTFAFKDPIESTAQEEKRGNNTR